MKFDAFGNWELYQNTIPAGMAPQGVITTESGDVGAMFYIPETKLFVRLNAGAVNSIDQRAIRNLIGWSKS